MVDDDPPASRPDPSGRPWVHPSELPVLDLAGPRRPRSALPLTAVMAGALAAFGVAALLLDALGERAGPVGAREEFTALGSTLASLTAGPGGRGTATVTRSLGPGVLGVAAWRGSRVSYGSAVVYRADGYLVTAARLVRGGATVEVVSPSGGRVAARVVGVDPHNDLALLRVTGHRFPVAGLAEGTPVELQAGDACLVVVAEPERDHALSVVPGVVAATGRVKALGEYWLVDVMEVKASLDEGAPGGALLDRTGRPAGLLVSPAGRRGLTVVPTAAVRRSAEQLLAKGRVDYPWLGIETWDENGEGGAGVVVSSVVPGGPAAAAGVEQGDVILQVGEESIESVESLMRAVRHLPVGERVLLVLRRGRALLTVEVEVAPRPH